MSWISRTIRGVTRYEIALLLLLLTCYAYFLPRWADWNQNSRLDLVRALVDDHTTIIDKYVANTGDYATYLGHSYSDKAPGMALLGVPVYAAFEHLTPRGLITRLNGAATHNGALDQTLNRDGTGLASNKLYTFVALVVVSFFAGAVPAVVLGVLLFRVMRWLGCGERPSFVAAALYGLATSAFPYANSLVGHQTSAFLLFAAFFVLLAVHRGSLGRAGYPLAGLLLGYALINEYQTSLIVAVLGLYALLTNGRSVRDWWPVFARITAGAFPALALLAAYDLAAFKTVLPVGYFHSALWQKVHSIGLISLTYPHPAGMWGITFSAYRGLFFLSPFLLFAILGYRALWRSRAHRAEFWVLALAPLVFFLFNSSSAMWDGGFAVGPRYLVPSLPFLAVSAGIGLAQAWRSSSLRIVAVLTAAWSVFAVWAETIGGQSFPDYTPNPLFAYSLPRLVSGDIARNVGMFLGFEGWASLIPLLAIVLAALALTLQPPRSQVRQDARVPVKLQESETWA